MMRQFVGQGLVFAGLIAISACSQQPAVTAQFVLPEGNVAQGEQVFAKYQCAACHVTPGKERETDAEQSPLGQKVILGGRTHRLRSDAELVTSIINPSEKIARLYPQSLVGKQGESNMKAFNDKMTVQELVDVVAYVKSNYKRALTGQSDDYDPRKLN